MVGAVPPVVAELAAVQFAVEPAHWHFAAGLLAAGQLAAGLLAEPSTVATWPTVLGLHLASQLAAKLPVALLPVALLPAGQQQLPVAWLPVGLRPVVVPPLLLAPQAAVVVHQTVVLEVLPQLAALEQSLLEVIRQVLQ